MTEIAPAALARFLEENGVASGDVADLARDARFFEYTQAVDPIGSGATPRIPPALFPAKLHEADRTEAVPLDLADVLGTDFPATSPALLASYLRILPGESLGTDGNSTSELLVVMKGAGRTHVTPKVSVLGSSRPFELSWSEGDFVTLPAGCRATHTADADATLYHVCDSPLLSYLGAAPATARFAPTVHTRAAVLAALADVASAPEAGSRNRISVLLANAVAEQTLTITHTLWAMFGLLPAGKVQLPHRHQSLALDLVLDCPEGCYTLLGEAVDGDGEIVDPIRVDWEPYSAFVTPPGLWHAHHSEADTDAHIVPIQDAGLQTYLRSLDIRFVGG